MVCRSTGRKKRRTHCLHQAPVLLHSPSHVISRRWATNYSIDHRNARAGGIVSRSQIPRFRLPIEVINKEVGYILDLQHQIKGQHQNQRH